MNAAGNGLAVTAGPNSTVSISNVGGDTTASNLGLALNNATIPAQGTGLNPEVTLTTPLSLLNGGQGVNTSTPLVIENGSDTASIDLSSAVTVQDVLNKINGAGIGVLAQINSSGTGINVLNNRSGSAYSIVESSQTGTVASDLGIQTTTLSTPLSSLNGGAGVSAAERARYPDRHGRWKLFPD